MKRLLTTLLCFAFLLMPALAGNTLNPGEKVLLREGWTLQPVRAEDSFTSFGMTGTSFGMAEPLTDVRVPSTVAGALMEAGVLPADLFEGQNYKAIPKEWFDTPWQYENHFTVKDWSKKRHYTLRFDGLNYYADVWLNGVQLAARDTTAGVFCVREYDVTSLLKKKNHLVVRLEKARAGDLNIGFVDWNPAPPDESMGIVRDVTLSCCEAVSLSDVYVRTLSVAEEAAELELWATLNNHTDQPQEVSLLPVLNGLWVHDPAIHHVTIAPGETRLRLTSAELPTLKVENPRLWWCRGMAVPDPVAENGAEMYQMVLIARVGRSLADVAVVDFGIRTVEGRLDENGNRAFYLNGQKLLVLGGGWTDDLFLRDTPESLERQVKLTAGMGLNCIRFENIWGKDSTIYDLCDRYGLLALTGWSCQWEWKSYCGIPHDKTYGCILDAEHNALAVRYLRDQLRWLRNHPSVIGFLSGSDRIPNPELEKQYFQVLEAEAPDMPYVCSASSLGSLAGPSGNKMEGPYEYVGPEYWYDAKNRVGSAWGFNTETSIGLNMPQAPSVERMLGGKVWPLDTRWDYHCTTASEDMHSTDAIQTVIKGQFGEADSFDSFVRRAQAVDYDGTRAMFEGFRVRRSQCTGLVQWMLNSAWPSLYWQLYDYYGVPTAGYYGVKKGLMPLQVCYNYETKMLVAVNGTLADADLSVRLRIFDADSQPLLEEILPVQVPASDAAPVRSLSEFAGQRVFVFIDVEGPQGYAADNFYALPAKGNIHDWKESNWYQTAISQYADMRFLTQLPTPELDVSIVVDANYNKRVRIENTGATVAYQVCLLEYIGNGNFAAIPDLSDNYFSLAPGDVRYLTGPYAYYVATAGL